MNKKILNIIRFGIGILILILLFWKIGFSDILQTLKNINLIYFFIAFLIIPITFFFVSLNIYFLIKAVKNIKIPFWRIYKANLVVQAFTLLFPGHLGKFSWNYFLKGEKMEIGEISSIVSIDLIISFITSAILALVGIFIFFGSLSFFYSFLFIFLILFLFFIFLRSKFIRNFIGNLCFKLFKFRFYGFYRTFVIFFKDNKEYVALNFLFTFFRLIFTGIFVFVLFFSLEYKVSIWFIIIIDAMVIFMSLFPITINGLGLKESFGVYLYSLINVPLNISGGMFILSLFQLYVFGFFAFLIIDYNKLRKKLLGEENDI